MTVKQALRWLESIRIAHGDDVQIYFDCPHCGTAFTPGTLEKKAVHVTVEKSGGPTIMSDQPHG